MATSWALFRGISIQEICAAASWSSPYTFACFYRLDVTELSLAHSVLGVRTVKDFFCFSGFATVRTLLLLLCALLPIFVLFSDLSKIFTSADQHSAQTTHFLEKEDFLPPTASSLHSGDR